MCMDEPKRPTPERRRLSLTQAALGKPIPSGLVLTLNKWLVVQNLKIASKRGFIPEAFRLTLVKGIVRMKKIELRALI